MSQAPYNNHMNEIQISQLCTMIENLTPPIAIVIAPNHSGTMKWVARPEMQFIGTLIPYESHTNSWHKAYRFVMGCTRNQNVRTWRQKFTRNKWSGRRQRRGRRETAGHMKMTREPHVNKVTKPMKSLKDEEVSKMKCKMSPFWLCTSLPPPSSRLF